MGKRFVLVTANKNETAAILEDEDYFHYERGRRSFIPNDDNFYNVGMFGKYEVVHFELVDQGSVKSGASALSVTRAIQGWQPDAVILVGIAFGKDKQSQNIGDVLIATMIQDYESGKLSNGVFKSDGAKPETGKTLFSVFKYFSETWQHQINGQKVKCETGLLLSGDKVVDDVDFKRKLFEAYPRAIGGEMEGRGAYAACREERMQEWIVVKAICDWGESKDNPNKERDQVDASRSVVSLLKHIFSNESAFDKLPNNQIHIANTRIEPISVPKTIPLGYFINIGTTSCRLSEIVNKEELKETCVVSYDICDPLNSDYLKGIIKCVKYNLLPKMKSDLRGMLQKVFVDQKFNDVFRERNEQFGESKELKDFIREFYKETNLYFNILTKSQTKDNLQRILGTSLADKTAIINIGSHNADLLVYDGGYFLSYNLSITLNDIKDFVAAQGIQEIWDDSIIERIKTYISGKIGTDLSGIKSDRAFILKDELGFMQEEHYALSRCDGHLSLSNADYKRANRSKLFKINYRNRLIERKLDRATVERLYGSKYGHILIETILDRIENKRVIPKNDLSIHGSANNAYVFNVVISGSTHKNGTADMEEAARIMKQLDVQVTSPVFKINGDLAEEISAETEYAHLQAIDECDVLFVCNKENNGYIGESTKCEIYYAYALRKTIAFWQKVAEDELLSFIPREHWNAVKALTV